MRTSPSIGRRADTFHDSIFDDWPPKWFKRMFVAMLVVAIAIAVGLFILGQQLIDKL